MNDLYRELAPVPEAAFRVVEEEATRVLSRMLAGRKIADVSGPHGWTHSAVDLGTTQRIEAPCDGVAAQRRQVLPLAEIRVPFALSRRELDDVARGSADPDLEPVAVAARKAALAEDGAIFHGWEAAGIEGIADVATRHELPANFADYPGVLAEALDHLKVDGVEGPYAMALGRRAHTGVMQTFHEGYPVYKHLERLLDAPLLWAPGLEGGLVVSLRGGDFSLDVGRDFSIGYEDHDADHVRLYLVESFTYRTLAAEAAVALA